MLTPRSDLTELWAHVGPGRNRSVLTILDLDATYEPISETTVEDEVWYEVQSDEETTVWVSAGDFETDCASQVGAQFERAPQCALIPAEGLEELGAHIGPGYNRSVRTFLDVDGTYTPINQQEVEGVMWYQVATVNFGELWVSGDDFSNSCNVGEVLTPGESEPEVFATFEPTETIDPDLPTFTPTTTSTITPTVFGTLTPTFTGQPPTFTPMATDTVAPPPTDTPPPPPPTFTPEPPTPVPPTVPPSYSATIVGCVAQAGYYDVTFSFNAVPAGTTDVTFWGASFGESRTYTGNPMTMSTDNANLPIGSVTFYAGGTSLASASVSGSCP